MAREIGITDRRASEMQLLHKHAFMSLLDIAAEIGVSGSTVRRDMELLEQQGVVRRTHGGAIYLGEARQSGLPGMSTSASLALAGELGGGAASAEKQAIARAVADLISPGATLMLNGGTTCLAIARALQGRRLSVVTNSVHVASLLCSELATEVTLLGGYVYPRIGVALGATAEGQAESLHATQFVTSCAALAADGAFEPNQMMVDLERRMMRSADEVILAADHTKLGSRSVVKLCELADLDVIVTDAAADEPARQWLASLNTKVIFAR